MYEDILQKYWGYSTFRALQGDIIESIGKGNDTLGLMPTGGGKSLTFQVPTMSREGLCLVVTPLIALMKDQVENLKAKNIKAVAIYTGMSVKDIQRSLDNCQYGNYKFLYLSPERLGTELFLARLPHLPVNLIAVDESHCISQWGYDFRPSYLKIAAIRKLIPHVPILALTATATPDVVSDIQEKLHFRAPNVFRKSFERSNLVYVVRHTENKNEQLLRILRAVQGTSVVYVRNRKKTKEIAEFLQSQGISAAHFHAGLSNSEKDSRQKGWKEDKIRVIVATNAFGMGIDKATVRSVVHLDLPDTLEAYFQEAGRAGRDEQKAYAVLLYNNTDATKIKKRTADNFPEREFIRQVYGKLCNYLEVAIGYGLDRTFAFDIGLFCTAYKLPILPTYSALKIIQQAGFLELTDESNTSARVMFRISKEELNRVEISEVQERIIFILLRSYTGLFTEPAYINEELISQRIGISSDKLYHECVALAKAHIITYVPRRQMPRVTFTHERIEQKRLEIPKAIYEVRKERFVQKTSSVLEYAQQDTVCRSRILLSYFGERNAHPCGQCDICLKNKETPLRGKEYNTIRNEMIHSLSEDSVLYGDAVEDLRKKGFKEESIIQALRSMHDKGEIAPPEAENTPPREARL